MAGWAGGTGVEKAANEGSKEAAVLALDADAAAVVAVAGSNGIAWLESVEERIVWAGATPEEAATGEAGSIVSFTTIGNCCSIQLAARVCMPLSTPSSIAGSSSISRCSCAECKERRGGKGEVRLACRSTGKAEASKVGAAPSLLSKEVCLSSLSFSFASKEREGRGGERASAAAGAVV
jgi:hypothetical protein